MSLIYYIDPKVPPDECAVLMAAARDSWARIRFSRLRPRLKIMETTITQNLVYEMHLLKSQFPHLGFTLFESTMEDTHGDDLELCIRQQDGQAITYALQAKIIYHTANSKWVKLSNGTYKQMNHYVGRRRANQVELLVAYARSWEYVPMYLLYNYIWQRTPIRTGTEDALYGCSVVTAPYLQDHHGPPDGNLKGNVKFSQLHPAPAFPWHELISRLAALSGPDLLDALDMRGYPLQFRSEAETLASPEWQETDIPEDALENVRDDAIAAYLGQAQQAAARPGFLPRYRLLFRPAGNSDRLT